MRTRLETTQTRARPTLAPAELETPTGNSRATQAPTGRGAQGTVSWVLNRKSTPGDTHRKPGNGLRIGPGADFWFKLMSGGRQVDLKGVQGSISVVKLKKTVPQILIFTPWCHRNHATRGARFQICSGQDAVRPKPTIQASIKHTNQRFKGLHITYKNGP